VFCDPAFSTNAAGERQSGHSAISLFLSTVKPLNQTRVNFGFAADVRRKEKVVSVQNVYRNDYASQIEKRQ
jgi:hypothetical protein